MSNVFTAFQMSSKIPGQTQSRELLKVDLSPLPGAVREELSDILLSVMWKSLNNELWIPVHPRWLPLCDKSVLQVDAFEVAKPEEVTLDPRGEYYS